MTDERLNAEFSLWRSRLLMVMRTISIECEHNKNCIECPYRTTTEPIGICSFDIGQFPFEWDNDSLARFMKGLTIATKDYLKGDETQ